MEPLHILKTHHILCVKEYIALRLPHTITKFKNSIRLRHAHGVPGKSNQALADDNLLKIFIHKRFTGDIVRKVEIENNEITMQVYDTTHSSESDFNCA